MKPKRLFANILAALLVISVGIAAAQERMTKDAWQQEMNRYTQLRNEIKAKVNTLTTQIGELQGQSSKLDMEMKRCMDELYTLVGADAAKAAAYRADIEAAEIKANELMRLSDADVMAQSSEVARLAAKVKSLWENKLSLIPEFWDRLTVLNEKVKSLQNTIAGGGKTYTVGTWVRDRDCLWNISKKNDIYNNAWMWPKIWQGNRDQVKDPDIIHPGQKLRIPPGGVLTKEEKSAAKSYYTKKSGHPARLQKK